MRQAYLRGETLGLTPYEFQLLRFLADRVGRVFTRQELLSRVWGYRHVGRVRTVDTHVLNLRAKLGSLGDRLQSVRGMGYKLQRADAAVRRRAAAPARLPAALARGASAAVLSPGGSKPAAAIRIRTASRAAPPRCRA